MTQIANGREIEKYERISNERVKNLEKEIFDDKKDLKTQKIINTINIIEEIFNVLKPKRITKTDVFRCFRIRMSHSHFKDLWKEIQNHLKDEMIMIQDKESFAKEFITKYNWY